MRHFFKSTLAIGFFLGIMASLLFTIALNSASELRTPTLIQLLTSGVLAASVSALSQQFFALLARKPDELSRVSHMAQHDSLTGLMNRAQLHIELEQTIEQSAKQQLVFGVLFLDLDRFKIVNDSMGHEAGDELLKIVSQRLKSTVRSTDIVARFGGDEFVIICRGLLSSDSVVAVAKQILKQFNTPVSLSGRDHLVGCSIGIAIVPEPDDRTAEALLRDADAAMYRAKNSSAGYAVFDEAHRQQILGKLDTERDLVTALEQDQLVVYYQPIVDTEKGGVYCFEALVRWNHPTRGVLAPAEFLQVAEEAGLMSRIGEIVVREACAQAAVWNHISPEAQKVRMSVNLAEQQLKDAALPHNIGEILRWSGLKPEQLILEITEDVIVGHLEGLTVLRDLKAMGISLAIDDFGTGQSSLSYVKQFDMVSTIKIDQTFVRDMRNGNADRAIIEAVVAMAAALEMNVVAEGVEHEDQMAQLKNMGVKLMQGFLFNRPTAPDLIDPQIWFAESDEPLSPERPGLRPIEISRGFARTEDLRQ